MILNSIALVAVHASSIQVNRLASVNVPNALAYMAAPQGSLFAASLEDNTVRVIDAATSKTIAAMVGHPQPVYGLAFDKKGSVLATGDESGRIWLWNAKTGVKMREFTRVKGHIRGIQALSFSLDGKQIASTGKDDVIIIWDVAAGKPVKTVLGKGANVVSATYSPKGGALIYGSIGEGVTVVKTGTYAPISSMNGSSGGLNDMCLANGGKQAIGGDHGNQLVVWDLDARKRIGRVKGHEDMVMHVAVSPNGNVAASSANDRKVILWDLKTFAKLAEIPEQSAVGSPLAFTADGKYLVTASVHDRIQIHALNPAQGEPTKPAKPAKTKRRR